MPANLSAPMFQVVPVVDVRRGVAVHAVAGDRAHYRPVRATFEPTSDPTRLARGFADALGLGSLYVADLDRIVDRSPPALPLYRSLASIATDLWVDAGVLDATEVPPLVDAGVTRVVVGSETVGGPDALAEIVALAGADRVVFSLDIKGGRPVVAEGHRWPAPDEASMVARAVEAGVGAILRLDLDRVGTGRGVDALPAVDRRAPARWVAGGGVRGPADLDALIELGYSAALVGSALLDGRIARLDLDRFAR